MIKKIFISFFIVLAGASCFAYFHFHEKEHLHLPKEVVLRKWNKAKPDFSTLHTGDLIFRHSRGIISNMLISFSQHEKKYSHVGFISIENNKAYVYHSIGGEENVSNKLRRDPLELFCNPSTVHSFGIYRLDLNEDQFLDLDSCVKEAYRKGLEFDTKFDFASDSKMYCTEFVYKTITKVVHRRNYLALSAVSEIKYVSCDDLYLNPHSRYVYSYNY